MKIEYTVVYSKRKTLSIIIERDRRVIVRAPLNTSKELIDKEIQKRKRLLQKKIDHNHKYPLEKQTKLIKKVKGDLITFVKITDI